MNEDILTGMDEYDRVQKEKEESFNAWVAHTLKMMEIVEVKPDLKRRLNQFYGPLTIQR